MDEQLAATVGRRIRRLREESGLGLREQAREIGISPSALSALENAHGGMSLGRLQSVAAHFGLPISDLLVTEQRVPANAGPPVVEVFRDAALDPGAVTRGTGSSYLSLGDGRGHQLQPALLSFAPHGTFEQDGQGRAGEAFAFVVHGAIELLLGSEVHHLSQGDAARFPSEDPHVFRNPSAAGVAFVVTVAAPPW
jgi:transcriptional regulator with XRE-family HTH domain